MEKSVDPSLFGLSRQTVLHQLDEGHYLLVVARRSRIIMADARKIVAKAEAIRKVRPGARVSLKTAAPLCSKSKNYLERNTIFLRYYK